jgi:hypothetical protein
VLGTLFLAFRQKVNASFSGFVATLANANRGASQEKQDGTRSVLMMLPLPLICVCGNCSETVRALGWH